MFFVFIINSGFLTKFGPECATGIERVNQRKKERQRDGERANNVELTHTLEINFQACSYDYLVFHKQVEVCSF